VIAVSFQVGFRSYGTSRNSNRCSCRRHRHLRRKSDTNCQKCCIGPSFPQILSLFECLKLTLFKFQIPNRCELDFALRITLKNVVYFPSLLSLLPFLEMLLKSIKEVNFSYVDTSRFISSAYL